MLYRNEDSTFFSLFYESTECVIPLISFSIINEQCRRVIIANRKRLFSHLQHITKTFIVKCHNSQTSSIYSPQLEILFRTKQAPIPLFYDYLKS